jgi:hypothetical protein
MASSLVLADPATLAKTSLYAFPRQAQAISLSLSANRVAWTDESGALAVSELGTRRLVPIPLPAGETASRVNLSADGSKLFAIGSSGTLYPFSYTASENGGAWTANPGVSTAAAGAWSADGAHLAVVDTHGALQLDGQPAATLASGDVHDLSFGQDGELLYWVRLPAGSTEIRSLNTGDSTATERTEVAIGVPAAAGDGVVCPVRVDGQLFFAEYFQGEYRVEKSQAGLTVAVAAPPAPDEGYLCPVSMQAGAR